jgi:hypothetical protein
LSFKSIEITRSINIYINNNKITISAKSLLYVLQCNGGIQRKDVEVTISHQYNPESEKNREKMEATAKVSSIFIYPVKSCRGISLSQAPLTPTGNIINHYLFSASSMNFLLPHLIFFSSLYFFFYCPFICFLYLIFCLVTISLTILVFDMFRVMFVNIILIIFWLWLFVLCLDTQDFDGIGTG